MHAVKRRIVKHGPSTLTVSLPSTWLRDFGIEKGDEVTVSVVNNLLQISTEKQLVSQHRELDVRGQLPMIEKAVCAHYKAGADDLTIHYATSEELERIHETLTYGVIGWEILEETNEYVRVHSISTTKQNEFRPVLRRVFLNMLSIVEDSLEAARMGDAGAASKLVVRDQVVNKLVDVCRRIINKQGADDYARPTALYHIVEQVEKIADLFKELNMELARSGEPFDDDAIGAYEEVHAIVRALYDLFFDFEFGKLCAFVERCSATKQRAREAKGERRTLWLLERAAQECSNLSGALMVLNF